MDISTSEENSIDCLCIQYPLRNIVDNQRLATPNIFNFQFYLALTIDDNNAK